MNRIRAAVRNAFKQARVAISMGDDAYVEIGHLVFGTARTVLAQVEAMVLGILDIVDGLITGTFRAFVPKD